MIGYKRGRLIAMGISKLFFDKGVFLQLCYEFEFLAKTSFANNLKAMHWSALYNGSFCSEGEKEPRHIKCENQLRICQDMSSTSLFRPTCLSVHPYVLRPSVRPSVCASQKFFFA